MEFNVHNVGFYNFSPDPINCMALCPRTQLLAVGRGSAVVEVYSTREHYYLIGQIAGCLLQSVEALLWVRGRLFVTGLTGYITEIDLDNWNIKERLPINGQSALCMASVENRIAVGSDSGSITLFEVDQTSGGFETSESLGKIDGRVVSLAWSSEQPQYLACGTEGLLYIWDLNYRRITKKFAFTRDHKRRLTIVWSLAFIGKTLVSADSLGCVTFWDTADACKLQSFKSHIADVLTLAVGRLERGGKYLPCVYASGVDPIVKCFAFYSQGSDIPYWIETTQYTGQDHDVRAMVCGQTDLICGGLGAQLVAYKMYFTEKGTGVQHGEQKKISTMPQRPIAQVIPWHSALECPLVLFRYPNHLDLVALGTAVSTKTHRKKKRAVEEEPVEDRPNRENGSRLRLARHPVRLAEIKPKEGQDLVTASISPSGRLLAYSDTLSTRVLALEYQPQTKVNPENSSMSHTVAIHRLDLPQRTPTLSSVSTATGSPSRSRSHSVSSTRSDAASSDWEGVEDPPGYSKGWLPPSLITHFFIDPASKEESLLVLEGRGKGDVVQLDCSTGHEIWRVTPGLDEMHSRAHLLCVSSNGELLGLGCQDGLVIVYSIKDRKRLFHLSRKEGPNDMNFYYRPTALTFDSKMSSLLVIYSNKHVYDIDMKSHEPRKWCLAFNSQLPTGWPSRSHINRVAFINKVTLLLHTGRRLLLLRLNKAPPPKTLNVFTQDFDAAPLVMPRKSSKTTVHPSPKKAKLAIENGPATTSPHSSPKKAKLVTENGPTTSSHMSPKNTNLALENGPTTSSHPSPSKANLVKENGPTTTSPHPSPKKAKLSTDNDPPTTPKKAIKGTENGPSTTPQIAESESGPVKNDFCFRWTKRYGLLLDAALLDSCNLMVVAIPRDNFLLSLSNPLAKKKYGVA